MAAARESCLSCCEIVQSATAQLWKWRESELDALHSLNIQQIGEIILKRLLDGSCEVTDCHINLFNDNNIHCVIRFAEKKKGVKASQIANLLGVDPFCIKKSVKGRYGYCLLLARLIGVREYGAFEYDAESVVTVKGRNYVDSYNEYHTAWLRNSSQISQQAIETASFNPDELVNLIDCINKNDILYYCDLSDLVLTQHPEWFSSVVTNSKWLQTYLDSRKLKTDEV